MTDRDVLANLKESVKAELGKCANEEIDKLIHKFTCEMGKHKAELISAIINQLEIVASENISNREITFNIIIKGGANNAR